MACWGKPMHVCGCGFLFKKKKEKDIIIEASIHTATLAGNYCCSMATAIQSRYRVFSRRQGCQRTEQCGCWNFEVRAVGREKEETKGDNKEYDDYALTSCERCISGTIRTQLCQPVCSTCIATHVRIHSAHTFFRRGCLTCVVGLSS